MNQRIAHVTIVVNDYDEAIDFYTKKLDFEVLEDTKIDDTKRWVLISPNGDGNCNLLLAKAATQEQAKAVGNQTGGRVGFFLFTDNVARDYEQLRDRDVTILRRPTSFDFGIAAVFEDLYGNKWDLIEPSAVNKGQ